MEEGSAAAASEGGSDGSDMRLDALPNEILRQICRFLTCDDVGRFAQTCWAVSSAAPRVVMRRLPQLREDGPIHGHWHPKHWWSSPALDGSVMRVELSVASWCDQGWGNRKGLLWIEVWRGDHRVDKSPTDILGGVAPHEGTRAAFSTTDRHHPLLRHISRGDHFRVMYNVGGGGGHSLRIDGCKIGYMLF